MTLPSDPTGPDTPPAEVVGYLVAACAIVTIGAFFRGPILNFACGPACVVACVSLASWVHGSPGRRGRRPAQRLMSRAPR